MAIDLDKMTNLETYSTAAGFVYFDERPEDVGEGAIYTHQDMRGVVYKLFAEMSVPEFRVVRQRLASRNRPYEQIGNSLHMTRQAVHKVVNALRRRRHPTAFLFE
jgi:hypothetical protein